MSDNPFGTVVLFPHSVKSYIELLQEGKAAVVLELLKEKATASRTELDEHSDSVVAAREDYAMDDLEIDDEPALSVTDNGVWVNAWVWVAN